MKLYQANGACSIGIHVLLEEIGAPYDVHPVKLMEGEQYKPDFTAVNPKSKVPTLVRDDGSVLTEYGAIATWLARTNPSAGLLPHDPEQETRALEAMDFAVGTVHMQGFSRLFRPTNFGGEDEASQERTRARGREIVDKAFEILDHTLRDRDHIAGPYSVADSAVWYVSFWGAGRMKMTLPTNLTAHYARMMARPAVQRTLRAEGFA